MSTTTTHLSLVRVATQGRLKSLEVISDCSNQTPFNLMAPFVPRMGQVLPSTRQEPVLRLAILCDFMCIGQQENVEFGYIVDPIRVLGLPAMVKTV